jgi:hypothetical protein
MLIIIAGVLLKDFTTVGGGLSLSPTLFKALPAATPGGLQALLPANIPRYTALLLWSAVWLAASSGLGRPIKKPRGAPGKLLRHIYTL